MSRLRVLGLAAYLVVCVSASSVRADDIYPPPPSIKVSAEINLRCSAPQFVMRPFPDLRLPALLASSALAPPDQPGTAERLPKLVSRIAKDYRIDLDHSAVNGEILPIDRIDNQIDPKVIKLAWHRPADASGPAARYVLNLATNGVDVSFDNGEYDGRTVARAEFRLRCARPLPQYS
jgi:hypothetical protein